MCSVGRTECVAYIVIAKIGKFLAESLAVLGLFGTTETGVLKKNNLTGLHLGNSLRGSLTGYVVIGNKLNGLTELLGKTLCNRCKALVLVGAVLYLSEMGAKDNLSAVIKELVDGRKRSNDTGIVGDYAALKRNVEITANQYSSALSGKIVNGFLVQRHFCILLNIFSCGNAALLLHRNKDLQQNRVRSMLDRTPSSSTVEL